MTDEKSYVSRLSRYSHALARLKSLNFGKVFFDNLSDAAGIDGGQVRKDLTMLGVPPHKSGGFEIDELIGRLNEVLGKNEEHKFIEVGAGNLGRALLSYPGFLKSGIKIIAAFDVDESKINPQAQIPVLPIEEIYDFVKNNDVKYGIISVPDYAAQQVLVIMVAAGIKGILNFAPIFLRGPKGCVINNVDLEGEIENLIYFCNLEDKQPKPQ